MLIRKPVSLDKAVRAWIGDSGEACQACTFTPAPNTRVTASLNVCWRSVAIPKRSVAKEQQSGAGLLGGVAPGVLERAKQAVAGGARCSCRRVGDAQKFTANYHNSAAANA